MENKELQSILKGYEAEVLSCLQSEGKGEVISLACMAAGSGLVPRHLENIFVNFESFDTRVPLHLMCRYLVFNVYKTIESNRQFQMWLSLLSQVNGTETVVSQMRQRLALKPKSSHGQGIIADIEGMVFNKRHVSYLAEILQWNSSKWQEIAISLGFSDNEITNIKDEKSRAGLCLHKVISMWVRGECEFAKAPTFEVLQKALGSKVVGLHRKAEALKDKLIECGHFTKSEEGTEVYDDESTVSDQNLQIVSQSLREYVVEGKLVLLEVQVNCYMYSEDVRYTWSNEFEILRSEENKCYNTSNCILCIVASDLTVEGSYTCAIYNKLNDKTLYSKPVVLTIETALDKHAKTLIDSYCEEPEVPEDSWPPVGASAYINLALIKQGSIHKAGEYGRCTIRGDADDIFSEKEDILYEKVFDGLTTSGRVLIEGRPGSGKTTLVHKVRQDWAKKKIKFYCVRFLFLIQLRGYSNDPNIKLHDLISCYVSDDSDLKDIMDYAKKHNGLGFCFILDGLDEYIPSTDNAYIFKLIKKQVLPKSLVIVASRPVAAYQFRSIATTHVEVLGFLKKEISTYIENYRFKVKSKQGLCDYLAEHPNVHYTCYLPIHASMVCFLYDHMDSKLPHTETVIYAEFAKFTVLRMLYRYDSEPGICIDTIHDLPIAQRNTYFKICRLAFEMCVSSRQVMKHTEVKEFFEVQKDKDSLGLITIDKMATKCGFQRFYTFSHLTFQEFLAACYISDLEEEKQVELIEKYHSANQMKQVWKFYCGLVQFNNKNSSNLKNLIQKTQHGFLFKVQCCFESQQPFICKSLSTVENNSLSFADHYLTPLDLTAIAYVMSECSVARITLKNCTGLNTLLKVAVHELASELRYLEEEWDDKSMPMISAQQKIKFYYLGIKSHKSPVIELFDILESVGSFVCCSVQLECLSHPNLKGLIDHAKGILPDKFLLSLTDWLCSLHNILRSSGVKLTQLEREIDVKFFSGDVINNCVVLAINCGIDDEVLSTLVPCLKHYRNLKELVLSGNSIGDSGVIILVDLINTCHTLRKLDLTCNRIGNVGAESIAAACKTRKIDMYLWANRVTNSDELARKCDSLHFHSIEINGSVCSGVSAVMKQTDKTLITDLNSLTLQKSAITGTDLSELIKQCFNLKKLIIDCNDVEVGITSVLDVTLCCCPNLTELHFQNVLGKSGVMFLSNLLKFEYSNNNIILLDLSSNSLGDEGASLLADGLMYCGKLCTLNVGYNRISGIGAEALAGVLNSCSDLHTLDISQNNIDGDGAKAFAGALKYCSSLCTLCIGHNGIGSDGARALAGALKHCSRLHTLHVNHNRIGDDGAEAFADVLMHFSCLCTLDASYNSIGRDGAEALASTLNHCTCLDTLCVSCNNIGSNGARALVDTLKECVCLQTLNIDGSNIGDDGAEALADTLKHLTKLHTLNIANNYIGSAGIRALANTLKECVYLQTLKINNNTIGDMGAEALADSLKHLTKLHTFNIAKHNIGSAGIRALANTLKECVYPQTLRINDVIIEPGHHSAEAIAKALWHLAY